MLEYQLLSPEEELEEIFPYRRVWRTLFLELGILLAIVMGIFVATRFEFVTDQYRPSISILLMILPVAIFYILSVRQETQVRQPRNGLLLILVLSAIMANGLAWPIITYIFTPERWLTEAGFFSRIIGYTLTLGVLATFVQYLVLRYTIWPQQFRTRIDGLAYSIPAGLGYASVTNLQFFLSEEATISAMAIRVLTNVYMYIAIAMIMGYFLGELALGNEPIFWLPLGLFICAFLGGTFIAFRRISIVSGLGSRDIGSIFLVMGFTLLIFGALAFLIESADERMAARRGARRIR